MAETAPYGLEFEQRLTAALLRDRHFLAVWITLFKPDYLVSEIHRNLLELISKYYEEYRRPPDKMELDIMVQDWIVKAYPGDQASKEFGFYRKEINELFDFPAFTLEFVKDQALKFCQTRALENAIRKCAKLLDTPEAYQMSAIMKEAEAVGTRMDSFGMDFFAERKTRALRRYLVPRETNRIPFFIPKFDQSIGGVGFRSMGCGIPELFMFGGGPNVGKSRCLGHMVKVATSLGYNGMVFSSEMSEDLYAERLDMGMGLLDTAGIYDPSNFDQLQRRLDFIAGQGARLFIKKYPAGTATIEDTCALARMVETVLGIDLHFMVWDYSGEFRARNLKAERKDQLAEIIRAQKTAVDEFECAGLGAFQLNREGMAHEMARLDHAAEDITPARVADGICVIAQTDEEYAMQPPQMRWCFRKVRAQERNQHCLLIDDRAHMRFLQHPLDETYTGTVPDSSIQFMSSYQSPAAQ